MHLLEAGEEPHSLLAHSQEKSTAEAELSTAAAAVMRIVGSAGKHTGLVIEFEPGDSRNFGIEGRRS